jgi:hypothetical protein
MTQLRVAARGKASLAPMPIAQRRDCMDSTPPADERTCRSSLCGVVCGMLVFEKKDKTVKHEYTAVFCIQKGKERSLGCSKKDPSAVRSSESEHSVDQFNSEKRPSKLILVRHRYDKGAEERAQ